MLTLEEFRATARPTTNIGLEIGDPELDRVKGWVYVDYHYVELLKDGSCWALIDNTQYSGTQSEIEEKVYDLYVDLLTPQEETE